MHLEAHEEHLIRQLRTPLERDDLEQSLQRITEHEVHMGASVITERIQGLNGDVIFMLVSMCRPAEEDGGAEQTEGGPRRHEGEV